MKVHRWICFFSFWHAYLSPSTETIITTYILSDLKKKSFFLTNTNKGSDSYQEIWPVSYIQAIESSSIYRIFVVVVLFLGIEISLQFFSRTSQLQAKVCISQGISP